MWSPRRKCDRPGVLPSRLKLEHDILEIETNWIKNQISEDKNYILLENEKPSRSFLNMESGKGGYSNQSL